MINPNYYQDLLNKYSVNDESKKTSLLTGNIILDNYERKNLHFNFPKNDCHFEKVVNQIYEKLSIEVFKIHADFPPLTINDKLKRIGGSSKEIFIVSKIENNLVYLTNTKDNTLKLTIAFDNLIKKYIPIKQNANERTLAKYKDYFSKINENDFLPTYFSKKIVFVANKYLWDKLELKNKIPSVYLPNTKEENQTTLKSIPALEDCIAYVTPKYDVCYEQLLRKGIQIDTLIICDTDENCVPQIIQDQLSYKFKIIVLTNAIDNQSFTDLVSWNWKKEEIELIESL